MLQIERASLATKFKFYLTKLHLMSTHVGIEPDELVTEEELSNVDYDPHFTGYYHANIRSHTTADDKIKFRMLGYNTDSLFTRNGVVRMLVQDADGMCETVPFSWFKHYAKDCLCKHVASLNGNCFVVKQIIDGRIVSVSDVCYGGQMAMEVVKNQLQRSEQVVWYP